MAETKEMRRTPLHGRHLSARARMVEFADHELPAHYSGVMDEHAAVRERVGVFDVSHMGEIALEGKGAPEAADLLVSNRLASLENGRACYTGVLTEQGTFVDDVIAYRINDERVLLCVNAVNREKVLAHVKANAPGSIEVRDESDDWAQVAVQGPEAVALVDNLASETTLTSLKRFRFTETKVAGATAMVARTGYTGEDGFELFCSSDDATSLWDAITEVGAIPCGLGARDTLRLEAGLALYGNDIDEEHSPLEAGMGWTVKLDKGDFIGRDALVRQKEGGVARRLVGFELIARGVPRNGMAILDESGRTVGKVTSGTMSPTLKKPIGMAYVPSSLSEPGTPIRVDIRGRPAEAKVVAMPFYKR